LTLKLLLALLLCCTVAGAQNRQRPALTDALEIDKGFIEIDSGVFHLKFVRSSGTLAALEVKAAGNFDFTPADRLTQRSANGYHHLGDLILRVRKGSGEWQDYDTAKSRKEVGHLGGHGDVMMEFDLSPTLPDDCPLSIKRSWASGDDGDAFPILGDPLPDGGRPSRDFVLRFTLENRSSEPVEIGGLGIPMVFNNILSDRNLKQSNEICCFFDPYVGQDAGYLQVTRLKGAGPALLVVPEGPYSEGKNDRLGRDHSVPSPLEAWMPLNEPTRPNQTFEGVFSWMVHTKAHAEKEWAKADPWNPPTAAIIPPGGKRTYGVRFILSPDIRSIEKTLKEARRPVAVGVPGYILPIDQEGRLFLNYKEPVARIEVEPKGALIVRSGDRRSTTDDRHDSSGIQPSVVSRHPSNLQRYVLQAKKWGRARLTVVYADGQKQSIHYYVTKPAAEVVADLGKFLFTKQWFDEPNDPFHRSPSVIGYDREADKQVTQDSRVWIAGLGDEGGSGSWLAAAMKLVAQPDAEQTAKYEEFTRRVLWGGLQYSDGPNKYGVRKSLFFYDPKEMPEFPYDPARDWRSWTSWNKKASEDIGRGYNYPHVVAAYWAMYRVKREEQGRANHSGQDVSASNRQVAPSYSPLSAGAHNWEWYLTQAYETAKFAFGRDSRGRRRVGYVELGLMEGTIFLTLLEDLKREGRTEKATEIERLMKERADRWSKEEYPFGSEMAWDSTGQEEVYAWCRYFGYEEKAEVSLNSILAYMPTLPHWGYNGCARRYWDFLYGGKLSRIERQLHHYGSGLNALPVLAEYRRKPDDLYLLRVGYGGMMGALSNIDQEGFASVAFHSFPQTLKWDAYSGDYGPNFFGHVMNSGCYVVRHPEYGWLAFGGNVREKGDMVSVKVVDSVRKRIFVAPLKLWMRIDAGKFDSLEVNEKTGKVRVALKGMGVVRLRIDGGHAKETVQRGEYIVPLGRGVKWVEVAADLRTAGSGK
jgi:hypothetical protein